LNRGPVTQFFIRSMMTVFWCVVIVVFLFLPRVTAWIHPQKCLNIFTFPLLIDAQRVAEFESRTGVKIHMHYYESNDELFAKMYATNRHGYDIIIPSDYEVQQFLSYDGLLKKIDKSKLHFWHRLNPRLLGHYYDPNNEYSIPYHWEIYGLGFSYKMFGGIQPPATWDVLFDPAVGPAYVGMANNVLEISSLVALYLFGSLRQLNDAEVTRMKQLLIEQKKRVAVYTDLRANYLLQSKVVAVTICSAGDIRRHDIPGLGFIVPREGGFVSIDNVCIPGSSDNDDIVYQFINFLYEADVMQHHVDIYSLWPALTDVTVKNDCRDLMTHALQNFTQFHFFEKVASDKQLSQLWIDVKSR
jgi:spermidine/putrescine transport system substrate-binding protein